MIENNTCMYVLRTCIPIFSIDRNYKISSLNPREPELHNLTKFSQYIKFYNNVNKTMTYDPHHMSVHFDISLFRFSFCLNVNLNILRIEKIEFLKNCTLTK